MGNQELTLKVEGLESCVYQGHLFHSRWLPKKHLFKYPVYYMFLDLDELPALSRKSWLMGHNRFRPFSIYDRDYLRGGASGIKAGLLESLAAENLALPGGRIFLLTQMRVFGYVFNPVSYYYCFGADGSLTCMVAEVNNTFSERYVYSLAAHNQQPARLGVSYRTPKKMHVSPFVSMDGEYRFNFQQVGEGLDVSMDMWENGKYFFHAHLDGARKALHTGNLLWCLLRYPFMTLQIIALIHWEALFLWLKGMPFYPKPQASPQTLSRRQRP